MKPTKLHLFLPLSLCVFSFLTCFDIRIDLDLAFFSPFRSSRQQDGRIRFYREANLNAYWPSREAAAAAATFSRWMDDGLLLIRSTTTDERTNGRTANTEQSQSGNSPGKTLAKQIIVDHEAAAGVCVCAAAAAEMLDRYPTRSLRQRRRRQIANKCIYAKVSATMRKSLVGRSFTRSFWSVILH